MTTSWKRRQVLTILLLLALYARLASASRELSFTSDEPSHIATGYAYLARGATWTVPLRGHPPLLNAWLTIPFYLGTPNIPVDTLTGWQEDNTTYVQAFVPFLREDVTRAEVTTRTPVMLLAVLLAAVVTRWAQSLTNPWGGVLSLLILLSDPTFLAHGGVATNDVGVLALGTLGLLITYRSIQHTTPSRIVAAGITMGLTMLAKGSGIIWFAGALLMVAGSLLVGKKEPAQILRSSLLGFGMACIAVLCIWGCYGFEWGTLELGTLNVTVPAPTHWQSIVTQSSGAEVRWTYFLGSVRQGGSWTYFPVAAWIKNPIPLLILGTWGLVSCLRQRRRHARDLMVWIFPILYTGSAIASGVNIGYRHMLPVHPFIYLLAAQLPLKKLSTQSICGILIGWLTIESLLTAPYYISYISPMVGGAEQGWRYLADSNTDWGQGYKALRAYQTAHPELPTLRYSGPEGYIGLSTYGNQYEALPPVHSNPAPLLVPNLHPDPGLYAISANSLSGLGSVAPDNYAWFRHHQADTVIADVIFIYDVAPLPDDTWLAQCAVPVAPLTPATIAAGFSTPPSRQLTFDCSQSWIYPSNFPQPGWYVLHEQVMTPDNLTYQRLGLAEPQALSAFTARRLEGLSISYRQWDYRESPAFLIYEAAGATSPGTPPSSTAFVAYAESAPRSLTTRANLPVTFGEMLTLLEVRAYQNDDALDIETWWQIAEQPSGAPFSVMAHLATEDGATVAVADGFSFAPADLAPGDIVVQSHTFASPGEAESLWFRTGAYPLESTQLWTTQDQAGNAVFLPLKEVIMR